MGSDLSPARSAEQALMWSSRSERPEGPHKSTGLLFSFKVVGQVIAS